MKNTFNRELYSLRAFFYKEFRSEMQEFWLFRRILRISNSIRLKKKKTVYGIVIFSGA